MIRSKNNMNELPEDCIKYGKFTSIQKTKLLQILSKSTQNKERGK